MFASCLQAQKEVIIQLISKTNTGIGKYRDIMPPYPARLNGLRYGLNI
jgi:hypothetical protein